MPAVLITGANRGLGLKFARQVADGWQVFAACRNPASAGELQRLAKDSSGKLTVVAMDVTEAASIRKAAIRLEGVAIDLVINSAGIVGVSGQRACNIDYASWARVLDVNTMGPLRVLEAFIDHIGRSERRLAIGDNTSGGSIAYRTSKAAVNMVMRSAAIDLAPRRITCVVVNPGWVKTDIGGSGATLTVTALRSLIETLGPNNSGKFYHYDGSEYPW